MIRGLTILTLALVLTSTGPAGTYNKKVSIGDTAPAFTNLEGVDGKKHSLSDYKKEVVVLVITCNHCEVAIDYEDRIIKFTKQYGDKVDVVAINVNNVAEDKLPKMVARAKEKGFNFPYLHDPSQKIGRALGALVTPEFFVLNKERKIVYMGAMDDDQEKPTRHYLNAAVEATLKGAKVEKAETRPFGCGLVYE